MKRLFIAVCLLLTIQAHSQEKIRILNVRHDAVGSTYYTAQYRVPLPANLTGINHAADIVNAYKTVYRIEALDTINNVVYAVFNIEAKPMLLFKDEANTIPNMPDDYYAPLEAQYLELETGLVAFQLLPSDYIIGKKLIGNTWQESQ